MSSIEEKLRTIREIQQSLTELQNNLKQDQNKLDNEISQMKSSWTDIKMTVFASTYASKFTFALVQLMSRIEKAIGFLENKYSTLESHRN